MSILTALGGIAAAVWLIVALLPWQPHRTRERLNTVSATLDLSDVTVLIPARNEADHINQTLASLASQGPGLQVIVVDDRSSDATASLVASYSQTAARSNSGLSVELLAGKPLPAGWGGKLWALQQGLDLVSRRYTLLLDADIDLRPGVVAALLDQAQRESATLVSVMATLRCSNFWERLLVPPFIFFFKLLYPFALVAKRESRVAAAAGGCILVETAVLHDVGAFGAWKDALIDDCTLARHVRSHQAHGTRPMRLVMSHEVRSLRSYERPTEFWQMVARTAYTQLRYSLGLLFLTTAVMLLVFGAPFAAIAFAGSSSGLIAGVTAIGLLIANFIPVARFYRLPIIFYLTLPLAAGLFLAMTWHSAINYYAGTRATWKSRQYDSNI